MSLPSPSLMYWPHGTALTAQQQFQFHMATFSAAANGATPATTTATATATPAYPIPVLAHQASTIATPVAATTPTNMAAVAATAAAAVPNPSTNGASIASASAVAAAAAAADKKNNEERRPWTKEEDFKVMELVKKYGTKKWSLVGSCLEGRTGKQCRERSDALRERET